ncbi:CDP-glucose 4,6-dehydratase [Granulicella sp. 5B5]|nr:CDP-glucose 4,6-dehydratase [Granulicella sp. 5B5]
MALNFWKSRRVFLTGHTGFKGSWLSLWLLSMGAEVSGYSLEPSTSPNLYSALGLAKDMASTIADVRDADTLERTIRSFRPEIVIHMAAQPLVRYSYENPVETYATNVMGTVHLLNAVRHTPEVRSVVIVTSDKCYENREWVWPYREDEAMGGYDPYSSSKGCAELVTAAFRRSYFPPDKHSEHKVAITSGRAGNVIGGGDWAPDRLVPDIIRSFTANQPAIIRNPRAVRPWQHVLEPLSGYLTLAERPFTDGQSVTGAWNFGPSEAGAQPVRYLADSMVKAWGDGAAWVPAEDEQAVHEAHLLNLDSSKARTLLGWRPRWRLDEALAHTVDWYREFYHGGDIRSFSLRQIEHYASNPTA